MIPYERLMQIAYCNSQSVLELTERLCIRAIEDEIEGDFAEAGVAMGVHGIIMKMCAVKQKVYLYDSFQGVSTHTDEDKEWTEAHGKGEGDPRKSGGITVCPLDNVKATMASFLGNLNGIEFVEGWFADTLPKLNDEKFSVLRLDCDLYLPYKDCLRYLLPRLSYGGWIIVDDLSLTGAKKAIAEAGIDIDAFVAINNGTIGFMQWQEQFSTLPIYDK